MPSKDIYTPKQQRSIDTQKKLITALHLCLKNKFFEHISIKEIAEQAGVSVGTFYRRFKDKESLLPMLYQDFGHDLATWAEKTEQKKYRSLAHATEVLSNEMLNFLITRKGVFRTLHLNSRLHSEILAADKKVDRKEIYQRLANILLRFEDEITAEDKSKAASTAIYTLINGLLDKVLYPKLTPAIACDLNAKEYAAELPKMLSAYLSH